MVRGDQVHSQIEHIGVYPTLLCVNELTERTKLVAIVASHAPHGATGLPQGFLIRLAANRSLPDLAVLAFVMPSAPVYRRRETGDRKAGVRSRLATERRRKLLFCVPLTGRCSISDSISRPRRSPRCLRWPTEAGNPARFASCCTSRRGSCVSRPDWKRSEYADAGAVRRVITSF